MNEKAPEAVSVFNQLKETLAARASEKIETIAGDAFKLLEMNPDLKADVILCRNWIHFLSDEEQYQFFDMVKKILNPGGELILTVNGAYNSEVRLIHKTDPRTKCFTLNQTMLFSRQPVNMDIPVAKTLSKYQGKFSERKIKNSVIYHKRSNGAWTLDQGTAQNLPSETYTQIKSWVEENKKLMKQVTFGNMQNVENVVQLYTRETLAALLTQHGFSVSTTFVTDPQGHYLQEDEDPYIRGDRTGAIATVNEAPSAAVLP